MIYIWIKDLPGESLLYYRYFLLLLYKHMLDPNTLSISFVIVEFLDMLN